MCLHRNMITYYSKINLNLSACIPNKWFILQVCVVAIHQGYLKLTVWQAYSFLHCSSLNPKTREALEELVLTACHAFKMPKRQAETPWALPNYPFIV